MIFDGHIHIGSDQVNQSDFLGRLKEAGVDGGVVISLRPNSFGGTSYTFEQRLNNLFAWTEQQPLLYPFFWIDPTEEDALHQVEVAVREGVSGFKVICNHFYPGDPRAMTVYKAIAAAKKPMLFHSGILWDDAASSKYNRPGEFEALLEVDHLRFALAHVSWPWIDENIAVYGKILNATRSRSEACEMFIDITPGTPPIYRKEVLTKLFTVGYDIENNILFGVDSSANSYGVEYAKDWINRDNSIYKDLSLSPEVVQKVYTKNLKRFLGITD